MTDVCKTLAAQFVVEFLRFRTGCFQVRYIFANLAVAFVFLLVYVKRAVTGDGGRTATITCECPGCVEAI